MKPQSYRDAGVNIDEGNRLVDLIKPMVKTTLRKEVLTGLGGFGALFRADFATMTDPLLVSGTDGVGTKLKIAFLMDKHDTVGIDLVAMSVNDIVVQGAEPLFFLDYFATGKLAADKAASVVKGIAEGCKQAGCALIGGETAEMPGFYGEGEYDLAGFGVGVVDRPKLVDGSQVRPGDKLIGLSSTGVHSNGFSLARKVIFDTMNLTVSDYVSDLGMTVGEALLCPTKIYVPEALALCREGLAQSMAHITGGGLPENLPRVLPLGVKAIIDTSSFTPPPIFQLIQEHGPVEESEMFRAFNMGIGFVVVVHAEDEARALEILAERGADARTIGVIEAGEGVAKVVLS